MKLSDLDYPLPKELIAQRPLDKRDASRLLVAHRRDAKLEDKVFSDILSYFKPGDVLVLNDTKVSKARILGRKKGTGGKVDALFLEEVPGGRWKCLIQPALKEGQIVEFPEGVEGAYVGRDKDGMALLELQGAQNVPLWLGTHGSVPLPPYIKREPGKEDESTYQTVYAEKEGAVAAPTAGLHWTKLLLEEVAKLGVEVHTVTLHVGYGTFKPVEDLENHRMHSERFDLSDETADALNHARSEKRNVWAVGTTTLRVLETCVVKKRLVPGKGDTDLYIR